MRPYLLRRRWFRFSLRTLLIFITVAAIGSSWLASKRVRARRQEIAVANLERIRALVQYDYQWDENKQQFDLDVGPPGPKWLRRILGDYAFASVVRVMGASDLFDDNALSNVAVFEDLEYLQIQGTSISDAGLKVLSSLPHLRHLNLDSTRISDAAFDSIVRAPSLQDLLMANTSVTDEGIQRLAGMPNLVSVDLYETKVTLEGKAALKRARPTLDTTSSDLAHEMRKNQSKRWSSPPIGQP